MTLPTPANLSQYLTHARFIASAGGKAAHSFFHTAVKVHNKACIGGEFDPVSRADTTAERVMRELIAQKFPQHAIMGEEFGTSGTGENLWILDPIDGTRAFITGSPLWGVLVGFTHHSNPMLGVIELPALQESYWADSRSAYRHRAGKDVLISTRAGAVLNTALTCVTSPLQFKTPYEKAVLQELIGQTAMVRFGGDCYNYAMLAAGQIDLVLEADLKPEDILPIIPILVAAGAELTNWSGDRDFTAGRVLATANSELHTQALAMLAKL